MHGGEAVGSQSSLVWNKKSTNNLNQSPTNIIAKITKPRYESQIRIQKFIRKTIFSFNGKNYEIDSK